MSKPEWDELYFRLATEKQYQIECDKIISGMRLRKRQLSEIIAILSDIGTRKALRKVADFTFQDEHGGGGIGASFGRAFRAISEFVKVKKELLNFKPFEESFCTKIEAVYETQEKSKEIISGMIKERLTLTSPLWKSRLSSMIENLEKLKKQIIEIKTGIDYKIHYPKFKETLDSWVDEETKLIANEIDRLKRMSNNGDHYPVEDYFPFLLQKLYKVYAGGKASALQLSKEQDRILLHGDLFNECLEIYLKLKNELLKARKIPQVAPPQKIFPAKYLAEFYDDKIEIARNDPSLQEEDKLFKVEMLERMKVRHIEEMQ